jgi:dolichyl-diphosphooligosaccharide--protein glycosyltransferase
VQGVAKLESHERSKKLFTKLEKLRPTVDLKYYLGISCLLIALFVGITIRISGFRYGFYLSEFDSYWHLRSAKYIEENGLYAFYNWVDKMSWYPAGRAAGPSTPPGLPLLLAIAHKVLSLLGYSVDITTLAILFPPSSTIVGILAIFLLGSELGGSSVGLLSALFLALNGSYIERTNLGFFKHETIGVPLIILSSLFFLKSLKSKDYRLSATSALISGLSLGYLMISWTGYLFQIALLASVTVLCLIIKNVSINNLIISYTVAQGTALLVATQSPRSAAEMSSLYIYGVAFTLALLTISKLSSKAKTIRSRTLLYVSSVVTLFIIFLSLFQMGYLTGLYGKLLAVINPSVRIEQAIIESVAEHKITNWYSLFMDHGFLLLFFGVALLNAVRKPDLNNTFVIAGGLSSLYFANMMARLGLIFSPFLAVLASLGISQLINIEAIPESLRERTFTRKSKRTKTTLPQDEKLWSAVILITVFILASFNLFLDPKSSSISVHLGSPVTIASASTPFKYSFPDWLEAVTWIRENTPPGSVILAWWDYGYWITTLGDRPTLIDNATINTTQVALVGRALISNDTVALPIMKRFNVSYVVVFSTLSQSKYIGFWGDEVKWIWMAEIGYNMKSEPLTHATARNLFGDSQLGNELVKLGLLPSSDSSSPIELPKRDFVLTKLMVYGAFLGSQNIINPEPHFELVFRSYYGFVLIYKVNYKYFEPVYKSVSASVSQPNSSYISSYLVTEGRSTKLIVSSSEFSNGLCDLNGTILTLSSKAKVVIKTQSGDLITLHDAVPGEHKLVFLEGKVDYYINETLTEEITIARTGPFNIGVLCEVSKPPENATIITYPKAEVFLSSIEVDIES